MRDLAAILQTRGHTVTHDEEATADLEGQHIDQVIVGKRVSLAHPVLQAAQQQGLSLCSYPEFIYTHTQDKQRIVITGQEKKLICLLALHVLKQLHSVADYVVEAPTLASSVKLSDAPIVILEGDDLPSAPIDLTPHSLRYQHHILVFGTMSWEASEAYPTLEAYQAYITHLADASPKSGTLIYGKENTLVEAIACVSRADVQPMAYDTHPHQQKGIQAYLVTPQDDVPFYTTEPAVMRAVAAVQQLVGNFAIKDQQFYEALATFRTDPLI